MTARLDGSLLTELDEMLADTDAAMAARYPGPRSGRQPVHTVYVPADRFHAGLVPEWGSAAAAVLAEHGAEPATLAPILRQDASTIGSVLPLVHAKLATEPIEDLRIDFEDGLGPRADDEEDALAVRAAQGLTAVYEQGTAPPHAGIRFKSLEPATRARGVRTLDLFVGSLIDAGGLPEGFVVTLPKVSSVAHVQAMVRVCEWLEAGHGLAPGRLGFEIQVETPQLILGADGTATVAHAIHAAQGRLTGLHFGTYDYSAAVGIAAEEQSLDHPVADHAKAVMQAAAAGTGVRLSDGSTNVLPVGGTASVHAAWALHARLVRRSLRRGFYQGWDLHPAHLPTRFLATFSFFRAGVGAASARLAAYLNGAAGGGHLDEPATARSMAGFLLRGLDCGAVTEAETGFDRPALEALVA